MQTAVKGKGLDYRQCYGNVLSSVAELVAVEFYGVRESSSGQCQYHREIKIKKINRYYRETE